MRENPKKKKEKGKKAGGVIVFSMGKKILYILELLVVAFSVYQPM